MHGSTEIHIDGIGVCLGVQQQLDDLRLFLKDRNVEWSSLHGLSRFVDIAAILNQHEHNIKKLLTHSMVQQGPSIKIHVLIDVDLFSLVLEHVNELIELVAID